MADSHLKSVAEDGAQTTQSTIARPNSPAPHELKRETRELEFDSFGKLRVHILGDLADVRKRAVFMTVHDIGTNSRSFDGLLAHESMTEICQRSIFINIDLPAQYDDAEDFPRDQTYPSIIDLGESLMPRILDELNVRLVIGIGDGAGANILTRFALKHPDRVLGLVLINLVTSSVGFLERLRETFTRSSPLERRSSEVHQLQQMSPEKVVRAHRGTEDGDPASPDAAKRLTYGLNTANIERFIEAYANRRDLTDAVVHQLKNVDILLVCGGRSAYRQQVVTLYGKLSKEKASLLKIDGVADVLHESNEALHKFAYSLLLFAKGVGYLTSLHLHAVGEPGVQANAKSLGSIGRRRTLSMEDYDLPRPRRLSLTAGHVAPAANK